MSTNCTSCYPSSNTFLNSNNCDCITGYYTIMNVLNCMKCDSNCVTCIVNSTNCLTCNSSLNRVISVNYCKCADGFY
jgi:proprotein convertase subtilisin/kexin type 5